MGKGRQAERDRLKAGGLRARAEHTQNMEFMSVTLEGIRCGASCGFRGGRRRATAAHAACRGGLNCNLGAGHGEERTSNMEFMSVTLEVSQLETSALKFKSLKSPLMSVMAETSQSAMGPYVSVAAVESAL